MTNEPVDHMPRKKWPHLKNGLKQTCPKCGDARLFQKYIVPIEACPSCGQDWRHIRAELAPSWAAMTISAHVVALIYHLFIFDNGWAQWQQTLAAMVIAIIICLIALPPMKGLFMAIAWLNRSEPPQTL
ncbi:MAG: DUF983 domain-containing protein [Litorimonas sp.]